MGEIKAPNPLPDWQDRDGFRLVFLGGSIEHGKATDWQQILQSKFKDDEPFIFLNPRRENWDSSWDQSIDNPKFKEQVTWELKGLEEADIIIIYFESGTLSPISMLELGLCARKDNVIVFCPEGFWRKGNIDIVCENWQIKQVASMKELVETIRNMGC